MSNYARMSFESTPGNETNTPTLSTKKIFPRAQEVDFKLNPSHLERDDELGNSGDPQAVVTEMYGPDWSMSGRVYPDLMAFLLTHAFGTPTSTPGDGIITDPASVAIPSGAHRHVWTSPFNLNSVNPKTVQFDNAYVRDSWYAKVKGAALADLAINTPKEGGVGYEVSGPANYAAKQSNPSLTATPESVAIQPFKYAGLVLSSDLASSGVETGCDFKVSCPVEPDHTLGAGSKFPDIMERPDEGLVVCTATIERRRITDADWDALVAATGFALTARWTSESIIASSYPYKLFVEFSNAQYIGGGPEAMAQKNRTASSFEVKATTGGSAAVTVTAVTASANYN